MTPNRPLYLLLALALAVFCSGCLPRSASNSLPLVDVTATSAPGGSSPTQSPGQPAYQPSTSPPATETSAVHLPETPASTSPLTSTSSTTASSPSTPSSAASSSTASSTQITPATTTATTTATSITAPAPSTTSTLPKKTASTISKPETTTTIKPPATTTTAKPESTSTTKSQTTTTIKPSTTTTTEPQATTTTAPGLKLSGPITVKVSNTVVDGYHFTGSGSSPCVRIEGASNVTIRNSKFENCHKGVYALNASNIVVTNNTFTASSSGMGRNAVQFDKVSLGSITNNKISVTLGGTLAEDHINLYKSNGSSLKPILVASNLISGGGPSKSGSGIMLGDGGGSYQVARNNILINPGQVGVGVASGTFITVSDNLVYSPSRSWSNVGIYVWNQYDAACSNHTVSANQVDWRSSSGTRNGFWDGGNCGLVSLSGNNFSADLSHLD